MLAGSNDVLAKFLDVEVDTLNQVLKVLLVVLPIAVGLLTFASAATSDAGGSSRSARPCDVPPQRRRRVRRDPRTAGTDPPARARGTGTPGP